jgi:hypothetical protein
MSNEQAQKISLGRKTEGTISLYLPAYCGGKKKKDAGWRPS